MFSRSLKTNIAVHLAVLLFLSMILIGFVMIIITQKALVRSEISKGYDFIEGFKTDEIQLLNSKGSGTVSDSEDNLSRMLTDAGFSCILMMDENAHQIYSKGDNCEWKDKLKDLVEQAIHSRKKTNRFVGSTWGVFWRQHRELIISVPLFQNGKIVGGGGVTRPLTGVYELLRRTQYILLIYIFVNTLIFTLIGSYRMFRITIKPLQRLVKRAQEYQKDDEMFFLYEEGDNEFSKLSKALNRMLQHITEDKEKLRAAVVSLEKANVDLRQAQKDIIRAEKLASVGRLSAGIAHEIGNPIGIITGYLELLKRNDISNDDRKEFLLRTEDEINRIDMIIHQLLDVSRPSKEGMQAVSMHAVIKDTLDAFKFHPLMADIDLDLELSAENDTIKADPNQLRQVILNLTINAADAISSDKDHSQGKIIITSEVVSNIPVESVTHSNMLKIDFIDNGPGIDKEDLENIFDPFYTTKEPGKGTGLGLSVCFMIVEGIGGKIEATSEKGGGATITLYLPLSSEVVLEPL